AELDANRLANLLARADAMPQRRAGAVLDLLDHEPIAVEHERCLAIGANELELRGPGQRASCEVDGEVEREVANGDAAGLGERVRVWPPDRRRAATRATNDKKAEKCSQLHADLG